jgi:hypothetical protein
MTGCPDTCEERTKHVCRVRLRWLQASRATPMYHLDVVALSGTRFLSCEPHLSGQQERQQTNLNNLTDTK